MKRNSYWQKLRPLLGVPAFLLAGCVTVAANAETEDQQSQIGRTVQESAPADWPQPVTPTSTAPNILLIMTDDVGFGASETFGGRISTPTFDALAEHGLRYNTFHTAGICSPTRASLLTGRAPQSVGMGYTANWPTPYEGYNSRIPESAATIARLLKDAGYNTAMLGKGHITPEWEMSAAGPFDRWPTGLGFEYFYGFLGADTSMFEPSLVENTRPVTVDTMEGDYHLDRDLADKAIAWLSEQNAADPDRPFFIYFATGTAHAPNHAPADWLEAYRGRFEDGWDVLREETVAHQRQLGVIPADAVDAPRPDSLPVWEDLPAQERALYARYMEAYAASLSFADSQIGRVVAAIEGQGEIDNTLIIYIQGDNGASEEGRVSGKLFEQSALSGVQEALEYVQSRMDEIGGPSTYPLLPGGWGWAMNAPFPWAKRYAAHFGGTRNGMVISWPEQIEAEGEVRSQFHSVSDIMPTLLEVAGVSAPDEVGGVPQMPIDGISMSYSFDSAEAPGRRSSQVFAVGPEFGLYQEGWMASAQPTENPWQGHSAPPHIDDRVWELYDISTDFTQSQDVSDAHPDILARLQDQFWIEAARHQILPLHDSFGVHEGRPDPSANQDRFIYTRPVAHIAGSAAPNIVGRSFQISATVRVDAEANGVIVAHGGRFAGYSLFFDDGRPTFTFNQTPARMTRIQASKPVEPGAHTLIAKFTADEPRRGTAGTLSISVDGALVGEGRIPATFPLIVSHTEGFDVGSDEVTPVDPAYTVATSRFTGDLERVVFSLD